MSPRTPDGHFQDLDLSSTLWQFLPGSILIILVWIGPTPQTRIRPSQPNSFLQAVSHETFLYRTSPAVLLFPCLNPTVIRTSTVLQRREVSSVLCDFCLLSTYVSPLRLLSWDLEVQLLLSTESLLIANNTMPQGMLERIQFRFSTKFERH